MSRLIVPAHAAGKTEIEKRVQDARNVLVVEVIVIVPGIREPVRAQFQNPVPLEMVPPSLVKVAFDALGRVKGEELADELLADIPVPDGLVN